MLRKAVKATFKRLLMYEDISTQFSVNDSARLEASFNLVYSIQNRVVRRWECVTSSNKWFGEWFAEWLIRKCLVPIRAPTGHKYRIALNC